MPKPIRITQLHFVILRTEIATQQVLHTTKGLRERGLNEGVSGAPRSTSWGETHDGRKTQPLFGADIMLQSATLDGSLSMTIRRHAQSHIVLIEGQQ